MSGFVGVFFPLDSAEFVSSFYGTTSMSHATRSAVTLILLQSTTRGNKKNNLLILLIEAETEISCDRGESKLDAQQNVSRSLWAADGNRSVRGQKVA